MAVSRGLIGFGRSITTGIALSLINVTDFTAIYKIYPSHVLLLSWFFFSESFTRLKVLCMIVGYAGVIFIVRPEFLFGTPDEGGISDNSIAQNHLLGTLVALAGSVI